MNERVNQAVTAGAKALAVLAIGSVFGLSVPLAKDDSASSAPAVTSAAISPAMTSDTRPQAGTSVSAAAPPSSDQREHQSSESPVLPAAIGSRSAVDPSTAVPLATSDAPAFSIARVIAATLAVLALVLIAAALLRHTPLGARTGAVRLESRLALTRGGALAVVTIEGRRLVLGVTPGQINLLAELDRGEQSAPAGPTRFDRLLSGVLRREGISR